MQCAAVRAGMGGKVRDMATGYMHRKVGIGMGGYVLSLLYGSTQAWAGHGHGHGHGHEHGEVSGAGQGEKRGKREREGIGSQSVDCRLGWLSEMAATVRVHKARQNPNVRNEQQTTPDGRQRRTGRPGGREKGTIWKSWREAWHGLGTWGHGTTRQAGPDSTTWVGRDVQSIIIIWRLIWCMCVQGSTFATVPAAGGESGTSPGTANSAPPAPSLPPSALVPR